MGWQPHGTRPRRRADASALGLPPELRQELKTSVRLICRRRDRLTGGRPRRSEGRRGQCCGGTAITGVDRRWRRTRGPADTHPGHAHAAHSIQGMAHSSHATHRISPPWGSGLGSGLSAITTSVVISSDAPTRHPARPGEPPWRIDNPSHQIFVVPVSALALATCRGLNHNVTVVTSVGGDVGAQGLSARWTLRRQCADHPLAVQSDCSGHPPAAAGWCCHRG